MSSKSNLIVLICLGDKNYNVDLTLLSLRSIRKVAKFDGSILLFTDFDRDIDGLAELNIDRIVIPQDSIDDPRNFRIYMHQYYDFGKHEKILYMDFDILVLKKLDFVFKKVESDAVHYCYAPKMPWTDYDAFGANGYIERYLKTPIVKASPTGICSGVFCIKSSRLKQLLKKWEKVLGKTPSNNDQHAFNSLLVKQGFPCKPFPNEWFEYPMQKPDARSLRSAEHFIFYHYNPVPNSKKYERMSADLDQFI